jgi:hypothetical protein
VLAGATGAHKDEEKTDAEKELRNQSKSSGDANAILRIREVFQSGIELTKPITDPRSLQGPGGRGARWSHGCA